MWEQLFAHGYWGRRRVVAEIPDTLLSTRRAERVSTTEAPAVEHRAVIAENPLDLLEACLDLVGAGHRLRLRLNSHARKHTGLTLEQSTVLHRIYTAGGDVSVSELAASIGRSDNGTSTLLLPLLRDGVITRHRSTGEDRRIVSIRLTANGTELVKRFREGLDDLSAFISAPELMGDVGAATLQLLTLLNGDGVFRRTRIG